MAQTTIASPQTFSPAYNPLKFIIDSTNKSLDGFRYIFDVYAAGTITIGGGLTGSTATDGLYKVTTITAGTGNVSWA